MQGLSEVANFVKWRDLERWPCPASCRYLADLWQILWSRAEGELLPPSSDAVTELFPSFPSLKQSFVSQKTIIMSYFLFLFRFSVRPLANPSHSRGSPFGAVSEARRPRHGACLCTPVVWSYTTNSSCINALYSHYMEVLIHLGVFEVALAV